MPRRDFPIPVTEQVGERFAQWCAAPAPGPAARLAATVMLVRDGDRGVEVFMQRRAASMAFAPRRHVFPGGGVDAGDRDALPATGPSAAEWAERLGLPVADAAAVVAAAIREVFEEAGVLLAQPTADHLGPEWRQTARRRLLAREVSLGSLLTEAGMVADAGALTFAAHWITPEIEPRRYDTFFFAALVPPGQAADAETSEADHAEWVVPAEVLAGEPAGLMPPTIACLEELAQLATAAEAASYWGHVPIIQPVPVRHGSGWAMRAEWS